jgi:hypothetical protein
MTRFLHRSASLVGLCMLALAIGCGGSSKKKVTCDGGSCPEVGKSDASGDAKKDGTGDVMPSEVLPSDALLPDGGLPDTTPVQPDSGTPDGMLGDTSIENPDLPPVSPDTSGDTSPVDTRLPDALLPDSGTQDMQLDTTLVVPDTGTDSPVILDAAADTAIDAPAVDSALDAGDDAEIDAEIDA